MKSIKEIFNRLFSFFKREKVQSLPSPQNSKKFSSSLNMQSSMPIAEIGDKTLWEIQTWDKNDFKNKIESYFVYLPNNTSPKQLLDENSDEFTQVFNTLKDSMKSGNINFLGEIKYDKDTGWSAFLEDSKEIQQIINTTANLIGRYIEINRITKEMDSKLSHSTSSYKEDPNTLNQKPNRQINMNKAIKDKSTSKETIVISDLHGRLHSWDAIKKQIEENPNLDVIILGDAMDRGDYGVEILLQIKELSDAGRVKYLPGNHDEFAYNYMKSILDGVDDSDPIYQNAYLSLELNGGKKTMEKLLNFDKTVSDALNNQIINNPIKIEELTQWLGNQPLQLVEKGAKDIPYVLAHAIFDPVLYSQDSAFNLSKAYDLQRQGYTLEDSDTLRHFKNVLWYRDKDEDTHYAPVTLPQGHVMVVGHTPQKEGVNLKYADKNFKQPMIFIDGGLVNKLGGFSLNGKTIENLEDNTITNFSKKDYYR